MDFSTLFHLIATWSFRIAIAGGLLGAAYLAMRGDADMPGARLVATRTTAPAVDFPPCQPIGYTTEGELVYSMDCEQLPTEPAASALAPVPAEK